MTMAVTDLLVSVEIGGIPIRLQTSDPGFARMLEDRYAGFLNSSAEGDVEFQVHLTRPRAMGPDDDVDVRLENGRWRFRRGDFDAEWDPQSGRGRVRHAPSPYAIDSVLRLVHTIVLARQGGFLLHAASAVRRGRAFLFSGVSGAGKTTISRLAPPDVTLLTDEVSYVRRVGQGYRAFGTPFAGELARVGENVSAPVAAVYLLAKGAENRVEPLAPAEAAQMLLRNILFFARDRDLVNRVFEAACEFVTSIPVYRLTFFPDARIWELVP
jgi:hypothetical protein